MATLEQILEDLIIDNNNKENVLNSTNDPISLKNIIIKLSQVDDFSEHSYEENLEIAIVVKEGILADE